MGLPASFSLIHSQYNAFLWASISDEASALPLSVLSAFTRLGLDPWKEAGRLAALPKAAATAALAAAISALPDGGFQPSTAESVAARLVGLLPAPAVMRQPLARLPTIPSSRWLVMGVVWMILALVALHLLSVI